MNSKIWIIIISVFLFILSSNLTKYFYLSKQRQIEQLNVQVWNTRESLNDLKNDISELSKDKRIVQLAKSKLGMIFPSPQNIDRVIYTPSAGNENRYSLRNILSPEVLADESH